VKWADQLRGEMTDAERDLIEHALKPGRLRGTGLYQCRMCFRLAAEAVRFLEASFHNDDCPSLRVRAERLERGLADVEKR
jgi:hypothetical protein